MAFFSDKFELSRGGGGANVRPMEGLRGFAVFLVFLVHFTTAALPWLGAGPMLALAEMVHASGNAGVDLFFVLSGYLIYGSLIERKQEYGRFLWRRVKRIYPAFTVVFLLYIALSLAIPSANRIPAPPLEAAAYLLQNFLLLPGIVDIQPMITVAWSLSYEMFYYLVLPLIIAGFGLRRRSASLRVAFFLWLTMFGLLACALVGGPARLAMFIAGILLYETCKSRWLAQPSTAATVLAVAAALVLVTLDDPGVYLLKMLALALAFFLLCYRSFEGGNGLSRAFSWTPLRYLGNMSYSYYLLHGLAIQAVFLVLARALPPGIDPVLFYFGLLPLVFAATLVPTAVLFLAVERPLSLNNAKTTTPATAVLAVAAPPQPGNMAR